jgi:hypothetical protein
MKIALVFIFDLMHVSKCKQLIWDVETFEKREQPRFHQQSKQLHGSKVQKLPAKSIKGPKTILAKGEGVQENCSGCKFQKAAKKAKQQGTIKCWNCWFTQRTPKRCELIAKTSCILNSIQFASNCENKPKSANSCSCSKCMSPHSFFSSNAAQYVALQTANE